MITNQHQRKNLGVTRETKFKTAYLESHFYCVLQWGKKMITYSNGGLIKNM